MDDKVIKIVGEYYFYYYPEDKGKREIKPEDNLLGDLGFDSLDYIEIAMSIEDEFNIDISDDELEKINTVQDVINLVKKSKK